MAKGHGLTYQRRSNPKTFYYRIRKILFLQDTISADQNLDE